MGIAERKEREKVQRQKEILDAAENIFFSKGYDAATMDEIAERAELSKGTIYLYFSSKLEVYLGINLRALELLSQYFELAYGSELSGLDKTKAIGRAYFNYSREHPEYFDTLLHFQYNDLEERTKSPYVKKYFDLKLQVNGWVIKAVQDGIDDGSIRPELDATKTALMLWALSNGIIQVLTKKSMIFEKVYNIRIKEMEDLYYEMIHKTLA